MSRQTKREQERLLNSIIRKAKIDTENWIMTLASPPTETELKAYQAGYIAGMNRGTGTK
jgi:hypothetical protein